MRKQSMAQLRLVLVLAMPLLVACGWHLRGTGGVVLPSSLSVLRVQMSGHGQNDPLVIEVRNALQLQGGAKVTDGKNLPTLDLYDEKVSNRVLSVDSTSKVREFMVRYQVSFRVTDARGNELGPPQTVITQRAINFDRLNVLATDREQSELVADLKRDAAQQILQRLSNLGQSG